MPNPLTRMLLTSVATVALTATAYTQTPQSSSTSGTPSTITLTGCLEQRPDRGTTAGYALNNSLQVANTTPRMGDPRIGTVGSATSSNTTPDATARDSNAQGSGSPAPAPAMYALEGRDAELATHVGHQVTIVGTLAPDNQPAAASAPSAVPPGSIGTSGVTDKPLPRIRITSVQMVADSCAARDRR